MQDKPFTYHALFSATTIVDKGKISLSIRCFSEDFIKQFPSVHFTGTLEDGTFTIHKATPGFRNFTWNKQVSPAFTKQVSHHIKTRSHKLTKLTIPARSQRFTVEVGYSNAVARFPVVEMEPRNTRNGAPVIELLPPQIKQPELKLDSERQPGDIIAEGRTLYAMIEDWRSRAQSMGYDIVFDSTGPTLDIRVTKTLNLSLAPAP
jgi:hypothetical protein